jgi:hypothetical protein
MSDPTEPARRCMLATGQPYRDLARTPEHMRWTTSELAIDFEVIGFAAPFVVVRRRWDGVQGTLEFTHSPRFYFNWQEDK